MCLLVMEEDKAKLREECGTRYGVRCGILVQDVLDLFMLWTVCLII